MHTNNNIRTKIRQLVQNVINENSTPQNNLQNNLIELLKSHAEEDIDIKYIDGVETWLKENASNINIEVKPMHLPPNVAGFTTKDAVYINKKHLGTKNIPQTIFSIIHEIGHYKEFQTLSDELTGILSEEDFDNFFAGVIAVEKRVDLYAEAEMHKLNIALELPEKTGIEKQPFDLLNYLSQYQSFMKQFHALFLKNKDQYPTFSDFQKAIAFGDLRF